jgi:hypothetical protein
MRSVRRLLLAQVLIYRSDVSSSLGLIQELLLYLLQLVQALRFDNTQPSDSRSTRSSHSASNAANNPNAVVATLSAEDSGLADLLIERSVTSPLLGNKFYWYLIVECEDRMAGKMYAKIAFRYMTEMMKVRLLVLALMTATTSVDASPLLCLWSFPRQTKAHPAATSSADKANSSPPSLTERRSTKPPKTVARRRSPTSAPFSATPRTLFRRCLSRYRCRSMDASLPRGSARRNARSSSQTSCRCFFGSTKRARPLRRLPFEGRQHPPRLQQQMEVSRLVPTPSLLHAPLPPRPNRPRSHFQPHHRPLSLVHPNPNVQPNTPSSSNPATTSAKTNSSSSSSPSWTSSSSARISISSSRPTLCSRRERKRG